MRQVLLGVAACVLVGCSHGHYQRAKTLGAGGDEWAIRLDGVLVLRDPSDPGGPIDGALPQGAIRYRAGVSDTVDLGVQIGTDGVELLSKFQLFERDGTRVALAPQAGGLPAGGYILRAMLPVLVGFEFGRHELTLGARAAFLGYDIQGRLGGSGAVLTMGASASGSFAISERWRLVPELGFVRPMYATDGVDSDYREAPVRVEGGLAVAVEF